MPAGRGLLYSCQMALPKDEQEARRGRGLVRALWKRARMEVLVLESPLRGNKKYEQLSLLAFVVQEQPRRFVIGRGEVSCCI